MDKSLITGKRKVYGMIYLLIALLACNLMQGSSMPPAGNDETLMVINGREVSVQEFLRLWEKNSLHVERRSLEEYLDMFVNFQLKTTYARDEGLHLEKSFQEELAGYRKQLSAHYLGDAEMEEKLVGEAYERLLYDVNASHILIRLAPGYNPDDTLIAWEKAMQIRERIIEGESFETVARATSDDPSAKTNSGNLGYFTVFQMAYPFENEVYRAKPGELSMPVKTRFGYHIIRVNDRRKSKGEIMTSHIMIGINQYDEQQAKEKVMEVYNKLQSGDSFESLAREHSTDVNSAAHGGKLPLFGVGRLVPDFENAAFALENPGDISEPVRTSYGWHIIKLIDRRDIPPFDSIKKELLDAIRNSRDERSRLIREALVKRLKQEWGFSENLLTLETFHRFVDERIFNGNWAPPQNLPLNQFLFGVSGKRVTTREFAEFIVKSSYRRKPWPIDEYVHSLYQEFVAEWLVDLEDQNLENKYPEFRFQMQEYRDGMLLFEITDREVWTRAANDSAGLANFHRNNRNDYMWDVRVLASIFSTEERRTAGRVERRAKRSMRFSGRDDNWVIDRLNRAAGNEVVTVENGLFHRGGNRFTDLVEWNRGVTVIYERDYKYNIVLIHEVLDPEPKTLDEARGQVIADYQEFLESKWVEELRGKYNVIVFKDVLTDIDQAPE